MDVSSNLVWFAARTGPRQKCNDCNAPETVGPVADQWLSPLAWRLQPHHHSERLMSLALSSGRSAAYYHV